MSTAAAQSDSPKSNRSASYNERLARKVDDVLKEGEKRMAEAKRKLDETKGRTEEAKEKRKEMAKTVAQIKKEIEQNKRLQQRHQEHRRLFSDRYEDPNHKYKIAGGIAFVALIVVLIGVFIWWRWMKSKKIVHQQQQLSAAQLPTSYSAPTKEEGPPPPSYSQSVKNDPIEKV